MEETKIHNDTNQPIETPSINPIIPKPNNFYKYLFLITFIVLIDVLITLLFLINKNRSINLEQINNNISSPESKEVSVNNTVIPTITIGPVRNSKMLDTFCGDSHIYNKIVGDNVNLILGRSSEETIIYSMEQDGFRYGEVKCSPNNRYVMFSLIGPGITGFRIYDTKTNSFIKHEDENNVFITTSENSLFITDDEKYLLFCSGDNTGGINGGKIINLPSQSIKFDFINYINDKAMSPHIECFYKDGLFTINFYKDFEETEKAGVSFNPINGEIINF